MVESISTLKGAQCSHGDICILRFIVAILNCTFPLLFRVNRSSDLWLKIRVCFSEIVPMERAL